MTGMAAIALRHVVLVAKTQSQQFCQLTKPIGMQNVWNYDITVNTKIAQKYNHGEYEVLRMAKLWHWCPEKRSPEQRSRDQFLCCKYEVTDYGLFLRYTKPLKERSPVDVYIFSSRTDRPQLLRVPPGDLECRRVRSNRRAVSHVAGEFHRSTRRRRGWDTNRNRTVFCNIPVVTYTPFHRECGQFRPFVHDNFEKFKIISTPMGSWIRSRPRTLQTNRVDRIIIISF